MSTGNIYISAAENRTAGIGNIRSKNHTRMWESPLTRTRRKNHARMWERTETTPHIEREITKHSTPPAPGVDPGADVCRPPNPIAHNVVRQDKILPPGDHNSHQTNCVINYSCHPRQQQRRQHPPTLRPPPPARRRTPVIFIFPQLKIYTAGIGNISTRKKSINVPRTTSSAHPRRSTQSCHQEELDQPEPLLMDALSTNVNDYGLLISSKAPVTPG